MKKYLQVRVMGDPETVNLYIDLMKGLNINNISRPYTNRGSNDIRVYINLNTNDIDNIYQIEAPKKQKKRY